MPHSRESQENSAKWEVENPDRYVEGIQVDANRPSIACQTFL